MSALALELRDVERRFGAVVALAGASIAVRKGTVHALLGENGAGKTTLMRIAYGMLSPSAGETRVDGIPRTFASPAEAIAAGVGMVEQHPSNVPAMTVWENVLLGGRGAINSRSARETVRALAGDLGFDLDPDALVGQLSVASQQRLDILKAISRRARILVLDEPTAILAPEEAAALYLWLRTFAGDGGTAIVVTHKLEEARRFTDDLTVLRAGKTVLQSPTSAISANELAQAMIGEAAAAAAVRSSSRAGEVVARADQVTVHERGVPIVRAATLELRAGEIVGIAGVEGSGHHQLMMALAGRLPIVSGAIAKPSRVALVPEDRHRSAVALPFSLAENAAIRNAGAQRGRLRWASIESRVSSMMARFDVRAPGPKSVMRTLSGGNQQKFVLGRELEDDPELVVAENPTRGLDIKASAFIREQLRAARDRGAAVLMYSSDLDELLELADRVLVVHAGVVSEAPLDRARIGAAMLGVA